MHQPDLLFLLGELVMLRGGGKVHEGDESGKGGDELEGDHGLSHVIAVDSCTKGRILIMLTVSFDTNMWKGYETLGVTTCHDKSSRHPDLIS